jgi:hypothetical protein
LVEADPTILDLLLQLWDRRLWIGAGTAMVTALGVVYAIFAKPQYYSEAIIMPKESRKSGAMPAMFSQLGGFGGAVAAELGLGNVSLGRLELVAKSREVTEEVVVENDLLPVIFEGDWDPASKKWKRGGKVPTIRKGVDEIRRSNLRVVSNPKQGTLKIGVAFRDSTWAKRFAEYYLASLNEKIRRDVILETRGNQDFLTEQLGKAIDPLIREKIQNLIALEIERSMLASTSSFDIIEKPVVPSERIKPKRKLIVILSSVSGFLLSIAGLIFVRFMAMVRSRTVAKPGFTAPDARASVGAKTT